MGYIYVLYHPSFGTNTYKIGRTVNLKQRLSQYNTGNPTPYSYKYSKFVGNLKNSIEIEKHIHSSLKQYRLSLKEFFVVNLDFIIKTIENICNIYNIDVEENIFINNSIESVDTDHIETSETIIQEINSSNSRNKHQCQFCNVIFSRIDGVSRHLNQDRCKARYDKVLFYERKIGIKRKDTPSLTCNFCLYEFTTPQAYSRHKNKGCKPKTEYLELLKSNLNN